jgi:lipoate-protein ligase A
VRQRYRDLHDRIGMAIASCGVATALAAPPARAPGLAPGACFDAAMGGEVLVSGRKTVGSAQKVIGAMLLQHGAIAVAGRDGGLAYRLAAAATAQSSQGEWQLDADQVAAAIAACWLADGAAPAPDDLIDRILAAGARHESRFRDPDWTWRR